MYATNPPPCTIGGLSTAAACSIDGDGGASLKDERPVGAAAGFVVRPGVTGRGLFLDDDMSLRRRHKEHKGAQSNTQDESAGKMGDKERSNYISNCKTWAD